MLVSIGLTEDPIDIGSIIAGTEDPSCGGTAVFIGNVRNEAASSERVDVRALEYEAHPDLAGSKLREIGRTAVERWGVRVSAIHRIGHCDLGEPTVVIVCAGAHRAEALDACRWMIDTVKAEVPIWKKEIYADGSSWVGSGS